MSRILSSDQLMQAIADNIERADSIETTVAKQNSSIKGRMDEHPVDIYWEFTDGDITYKTVIQVSSWNKTATNREIFSFVSLLRDIPGQTTGVYFTQPIYDKDTQKLAKDAGVLLLELASPDGRPDKEPFISNPQIHVDEDWVKSEKERLGVENEMFQFSGDPKYLFLYDKEDNCFDSIHGIISDYIARNQNGSEDTASIHHYFEQPAFLQTDSEVIPKVKLAGVSFTIEYVDPMENIGEDIVRTILDYVLGYYSRN